MTLPVTAVVVAYDSAHVLPACLAALARDGVPAVVVDNASGDGSADLAERLGATVVRNARNEGFGRGVNAGVAAAATPYCLITNPDLTYDPGAVAALLEAAARWPDAGILAPRLIEPDGRFFWQHRSLLAPYLTNPRNVIALPDGDCCAPFVSGASMLVSRDRFLDRGGFDPNIFLFYEDDDLCRRVADAGQAIVHVHDAVARHVRGGSSSPRKGRTRRARWHIAWSRAYVCRKWGLPDPTLALIRQNGPKWLLAALGGQGKLMERYGGIVAGAWAFRQGRTALEQEGLS